MNLVFLLFLATSIRSLSAFPRGAGGCAGGKPAVGGTHLWSNKTIFNEGPLAEQGYVVFIENTPLTPGGSIELMTNTSYQISVNATADRLRGVLMRVKAPAGVDTQNVIVPSVGTQNADVCVAPVVGITHFWKNPKRWVSGFLYMPTATDVSLDVTVVKVNDENRSSFYYDGFQVVFKDSNTGPTTAPKPTPPGIPTATPVVSPTAMPAVLIVPTAGPTAMPAGTGTPSMAPVPTTAAPTVMPVTNSPTRTLMPTAPTEMPTTMPVTPKPTVPLVSASASIKGLTSTFVGVSGSLNSSVIQQWTSTTTSWFEDSYKSGVPNTFVFNMTTFIYNVTQVTSSRRSLQGSVSLMYDQDIAYRSVKERDANNLIEAPYKYEPTKTQYQTDLQSNVGGFENVQSVSPPVFSSPATESPTPTPSPPPPNDVGALSGGAIAGIVIGSLVVVGLVAYAVWFYARPSQELGEGDGAKRDAIVHVDAPSGTLGLIFYTHEPIVRTIKENSVLRGKVRPGDRIIAVDGNDTRSMTATEVSKLLKSKAENDSRVLTITRPAKEEFVEIEAPAGSLGIVFEKPLAKIRGIKAGAAMEGKLLPGDLVVEVDGQSTKDMTAAQISKILKAKEENPTRILKVARLFQEEIIEFEAPAGSLGVVFEKGKANIRSLRDSSAVAGSLKVGDLIVAVDGVNVEENSAKEVSLLLKSKSEYARRVSVKRSTPVYGMKSEETA